MISKNDIYFLMDTSDKKHQKTASEISSKIQFEKESNNTDYSPTIEIISESKSENFTISESDLVFIKSQDNYCRLSILLFLSSVSVIQISKA